MNASGQLDVFPATRGEFAGLFEGLEVLEPGLTQTHEWRDTSTAKPTDINMWAAVGRKP